MPELLLELFSEEIPARFQRRAAEDLRKAVTDGLVAAGLLYEGARAFATPRRLALTVSGIPVRSPDLREEKKGPRVGAPQQAIDGFLKAAGLASIDQAKITTDPKKGDFYVAHVEKPGAEAVAILRDLLPKVIEGFPWPKSMRWGDGRMSWVRPLRAITATFGPDTEDPQVIPFSAEDVSAGQTTYGHRFLAPAPIKVRRYDDYVTALERARVVLDIDRRKQIIRGEAEHLCFAQGLSLIADEGLLEEVAGLVEWPVVMMGEFEPEFLAVPEEVIIATIRANQKCFCIRRPDGKLANRFILVANTIPADGGTTIVAGNERVIRARLSDAKFFYEQDLSRPLADNVPKLAEVVFHAKLGTQLERVERIEKLAAEIAPKVGADPELARRAARIAKADLVTGMVGEFPELQGLMGRYYAEAQGENPSVAIAIADHYKPLGPTDRLPTDPVAIAVALADKLDLLTGFWAIDEKPTGSRDPYALRRAALGVIRIIVENKLELGLVRYINTDIAFLVEDFRPPNQYRSMVEHYDPQYGMPPEPKWYDGPYSWLLSPDDLLTEHAGDIGSAQMGNPDLSGDPDDEEEGARRYGWYNVLQKRLEDLDFAIAGSVFDDLTGSDRRSQARRLADALLSIDWLAHSIRNQSATLLAFFHDRLKVSLRDAGARHDLVDAVITEKSDDILRITQRVEALSALLDTEDGKNLLAGYRRAVNILTIEEKKDNRTWGGDFVTVTSGVPEEQALYEALRTADVAVHQAIDADDYRSAMTALGQLRAPVDAFFEAVLVNDPDPTIRANRLNLLAKLRDTMHLVADFSKIAG